MGRDRNGCGRADEAVLRKSVLFDGEMHRKPWTSGHLWRANAFLRRNDMRDTKRVGNTPRLVCSAVHCRTIQHGPGTIQPPEQKLKHRDVNAHSSTSLLSCYTPAGGEFSSWSPLYLASYSRTPLTRGKVQIWEMFWCSVHVQPLVHSWERMVLLSIIISVKLAITPQLCNNHQ